MSRGLGYPDDGLPNQGWKLYITSLCMVIFAGLTTVARCATRLHTGQFGRDDYVIVCSLIFSIVLSVAIQFAVENGYGMHKADLERTELIDALRWFFVAQTPYKVVVCLNKISAVLFYQRLFVGKGFQAICWLCIGIIGGWGAGAVGATIWQCVPIQASWDKTIQATCIDSDAFWTAYAVGNILSDVLVLVLPIPQVLKLKLRPREKVMLCSVFALGGFVVAAGIMRTVAVRSSLSKQADVTYNFIPRGIWTLVEANAGIVNACLPILKKPISFLLARVLGRTQVDQSIGPYSGNIRPSRTFAMSVSRKQGPYGTSSTARGKAESTHEMRRESDLELVKRGAGDGSTELGGGIVRKESWSVTVESDIQERPLQPGYNF